MSTEWQEFDGDALPFEGKKILMRLDNGETIYRDPANAPLAVTHWREPACESCGNTAKCYGSYEGSEHYSFACDDCCGHGNEDGHCKPLDEDADWDCNEDIVRLQCELDELRATQRGTLSNSRQASERQWNVRPLETEMAERIAWYKRRDGLDHPDIATLRLILHEITCDACTGSGWVIHCTVCRCKTCGGVGFGDDGGTRKDDCAECGGEPVEDCPSCGYLSTVPAEQGSSDARRCCGCSGWGVVNGAGNEGQDSWEGVLDGREPFSIPDAFGSGRRHWEVPGREVKP